MRWGIRWAFISPPGQACDLEGADALLPDLVAETILVDKAYDADERVIERLEAQGKTAVIPPKRNRKQLREYDQELYKARHLYAFPMRTFLPSSSSIEPLPRDTTSERLTSLGAIYLAASVIWLN